ncbi:MAG: filamentous hemagglutinin N-terminal domain-containing protein, partial [Fusobacterium sp.]|uniref:filamentous hemagglutinin N-terminal domain-containing protein n=1 Tax=Fusobacterium sp. TaxID=68766 RepID=UPI0026DD12F7
MKKLIGIILFCIFNVSYSNIVVDREKSKNLHIDKTANNIHLINIENPNSKGISHNIFKEYNVGKDGIILNNSTRDLEMTKLAGLINENPNLNRAASTILTEVSGVNRSKIEGFTEIAGQKADYILANPNGIYINGAGFINTGNVTLSTGRGDDLQNPEKGQIEIAGKGLDLRNINKSELIARTAKLTAPVYGGEEVNIKLGSKSKENKAEIALDARNLGSIYAGRIRIISTEDGVGVKSAANIYATKGDIIIDTKGRVYLKDTQAKNNVDIKAKETEIEEKLIAENNFKVEGNLKNEGDILVNNNIEVKGSVENNKKISSNNSIDIAGNLLNNKDLETKKLKGESIDNVGKILALDNIDANDINNKGNINTKKIENIGLVNSGNIVVSEAINSDKLINLSSGELKLEKSNIKEIENSGKLVSRSIENNKIKNSGTVISEDINTKNIENEKSITVTKKLNAINIDNAKLGNIYSASMIATNIENKGELEALNLKADKLVNLAKTLAEDIAVKEIKNTDSLSVIKNLTSDKLENTGKVNTIMASIKEVDNKKDITAKNIKATSIKNSGKLLTESLDSNNIENEGNIFSVDIESQNITNKKNIEVVKDINTESITNQSLAKLKAKNIKANII